MINSAAHNNRTRTHIPDQMTIKRWLSLSLFVLRILTDYSDASFSLDDFALFANRFYWWSNFHVKPSFQKRPSYIIAWRSFLCKRILALFSIFFKFFQLFCDLIAWFTIKTIKVMIAATATLKIRKVNLACSAEWCCTATIHAKGIAATITNGSSCAYSSFHLPLTNTVTSSMTATAART